MDEEMAQIQHIGYRLGKLYSVVNYSHRYMDLPEALQTKWHHGLISQSTAPKHTQKRSWPISIINKIRAFREQFPNLGVVWIARAYRR